MSDTKLDPASLTAEERAIVEEMVSRLPVSWGVLPSNLEGNPPYWLGYLIQPEWSQAYESAFARILARRALFAPTKDKPCPKCGALVTYDHLQRVSSDGAEHYVCPKPAPPSEMPEAVREAARILRVASKGYVGFTTSFLGGKADALESWCRSQQTEFAQLEDKIISLATELEALRSQPAPAVAMTEELERVLEAAEEAECSIRTGFRLHSDGERHWKIREAIAAVRAQASQPQRVKLGKAREFITRIGDAWLTVDGKSKRDAALAELDAAEGRKP